VQGWDKTRIGMGCGRAHRVGVEVSGCQVGGQGQLGAESDQGSACVHTGNEVDAGVTQGAQ